MEDTHHIASRMSAIPICRMGTAMREYGLESCSYPSQAAAEAALQRIPIPEMHAFQVVEGPCPESRMPVIDPSRLVWEKVVPNGSVLATHMTFGEAYMHIEAWEVKVDDDGVQVATSEEAGERLYDMGDALGGDGPFQTVTIEVDGEEREYFVIIFPFCI